VKKLLRVNDFDVFLENDKSAVAPEYVEDILKHGLEQDAGPLVVVPSEKSTRGVNNLLT